MIRFVLTFYLDSISWMRTFLKQWLRLISRLILTITLLICGFGLLVFPIMIKRLSKINWEKTDGIVIFTGEIEREKTAIALYQCGLAPKLHISGRYKGFVGPKKPSNITFDCAPTTEKNVTMTHQWLIHNRIRSVRLVTSDYHMPRSILLANHFWKNIRIIPHAIHINRYDGQYALFIVLAEYCAYIKQMIWCFYIDFLSVWNNTGP